MIGTIVTTRGRMLMAKMVAMEGGISFTRAAVGTGNIPKGYDPSHLIGLNQYKMDGMITGATSSQETASITFQIDSRDVEEGFTITEAGLYADDPDEGEILYAYLDMRDDPQYIYPRIGDVNKVAEITLGVIIGQVDRITAMISPGGLVTKEQMEGALETKLGKGEDSGDSIIAFASDDSANVSGWTAVDTLQNGETHKNFAQKVSTMFKNLRYLWKLCGNNDISELGDGTITGAINKLNTGLQVKTISVTPNTDYLSVITGKRIGSVIIINFISEWKQWNPGRITVGNTNVESIAFMSREAMLIEGQSGSIFAMCNINVYGRGNIEVVIPDEWQAGKFAHLCGTIVFLSQTKA